MTPTLHFGEVASMSGPIVIGMFRDMGWNLVFPTTHYELVANTPVAAGSPTTFTVSAKDVNNDTDPFYTGTVHFSTSSIKPVTLPANTNLVNGVGTFQATFQQAGTLTITATDTMKWLITGQSNPIVVNPGPVSKLTISAPSPTVAGSPFNLTVRAEDNFANASTNYAGTVHFTTTAAAFVLPPDSFLAAGVGNFSATLNNLGSFTITATDTVTAALAVTSPPIVVANGAGFHALPPTRILDTRSNQGIIGSVGSTPKNLHVTDLAGMPASGVSAVVMNVTVTNATNNSYVTVFPGGTAAPNASNLNFAAGQTIPNLVVVKVGAGGGVSFVNAIGTTEVVGDVVGWYTT